MQYGVFRLRRHFLVKRADDGGAPKNEWNEEFEDIVTDSNYYYFAVHQIQEPIPNHEFSRIFNQKTHEQTTKNGME